MNIIITGLGNPGQEYEHTKHNVGYRVVKYIQKNEKFGEFSQTNKALMSIKKINKNKIIIVLPLTFVNKSGEAIKEITKEHKINKKIKGSNQKSFLPFILIHDDNDLPIGKVKISIGKSSGGHKGVQSVIKALKTQDFIRLRVGIQPHQGKHKKAEQIVLKKFSPDEEKIIGKVIKKVSRAAIAAAEGNINKARDILYNSR